MTELVVQTEFDAPISVAWRVLETVEDHVDWMEDAVSLEFVGEQRQGVGTTFDCLTKVGPISLTDRMVITEWEEAAAMGVRHEGLVTGVGRFTLTELPGGRTRFVWAEELTFPLWLGLKLGERVARPILTHIWNKNLANLKGIVEAAHRAELAGSVE